MSNDSSNLRLGHKISMLVLAVALIVGVTVGAIGDFMLRRVATDLQQARLSTPPVAMNMHQINVDPRTSFASPVMGPDGKVVGVLVMQLPSEGIVPAAMPASFRPLQFAQATAPAAAADELSIISEMRTNLVLTSALALGVMAVLGLMMARRFTEPLSRVVADLGRLASGDTTVAFDDRDRTDEVGDISRAGATFRAQIEELNRLKAERAESSAPQFGYIVTSFRELWAAARNLIAGEWALLRDHFRRARAERADRADNAEPLSLWTRWTTWVNGEARPAVG